MFRRLRTLKTDLRTVAAGIDPDRLTATQAAEAIREAAEIEKTAAGLRLRLAHRVDNHSLFGDTGDRSAAEWLARQTGQSTGDAARDLECSKRLRELPGADDAVRNGELSPDQAKAVTDGASADPSCEQELLDTARRGSLGELSRKAKARKAAALGDDDARARAAHKNRSMTTGTNAMGEGWGRFNGPAHLTARLNAQLKPFLEQAFALARREGRRERADALTFDAFMAYAGIVDLNPRCDATTSPEADSDDGRHGPAGAADGHSRETAPARHPTQDPHHPAASDSAGGVWVTGDDLDDDTSAAGSGVAPHPPAPTPPAPAPAPAPRQPLRPDVRVIVRVDGAALQRGHTLPGELCDIHGFGPVPLADVKALLPDAAIDIVLTNGRDVFNVTHLGRQTTAHQRVVLELLNIGCTRDTCGATEHLQVDHRVDWHKTHVTELANLDWLCPHDHRLKTHEGWQLEPGTGKRPMRPPGQQPWLETDTPGSDADTGPPRHAA